jgi:hypothetical protein
MKRHTARECTLEEFDAWSAATDRHDAVAQAADEEGGPRLSLVPAADRQEVWPTDLLAPAGARRAAEQRAGGQRPCERPADGSAPPNPIDVTGQWSRDEANLPADAEISGEPPISATPFDGVELEDSRKRLAGWSAERQRLFLVNLAETGSVHLASAAARLTARSAYRLRARSPAFAAAWDTADQLAVGRLSALAFDRAIHGRVEQVWQSGELVAEKRAPNDKLLMWLLARLDPRRFAAPWELRGDPGADPQAEARQSFPALLDALGDVVSE